MSPTPSRVAQAVRVLRGNAVAIPRAAATATKRESWGIHEGGMYGGYGEPPPPAATVRPSLYTQSPPVYEAVTAFANTVQTTPMHLFKQLAAGAREEVLTHEALSLLNNPNGMITRARMVGHWVSDLLLAGNAMMFLAGPKNGAPNELWRLNPRKTRVVRDKKLYVSGYITEVDGQLIPLDRDEVIHFPMPNPFDDYDLYGLPPLLVAALDAKSGRAMAEWNNKMFSRDQAIPAGIVSSKEMIPDTEWERVKSEWKAQHGGRERKTAFIRGGALEFHPIGLTQTDVDFLSGVQWSAEQIYRVFGTHHLRSSQYADDAKNLERMFLEQHVWPMLTFLSETLTDRLLTYWGPVEGASKLTFEFEDVRPRERALELEEEREESKGLTFNEWRAKRGLEPLEGYDDLLFVHVQQGVMPQEDEPEQEPTQPIPPQLAQEPEEDDEPGTDETEQDAEENADDKQQAGQEHGDDIGERFNKSLTPPDPRAIHAELKRWEKFTLKRLGDDDARLFEPQHTPDYIAHVVQVALEDTGEPGRVKALFRKAHGLVMLAETLAKDEPEQRDGAPLEVTLPDIGVQRDVLVKAIAGDVARSALVAALACKAIQATRLMFEADLEDLIAAARAGNIERRQWSGRMRTLIVKYGEMAYRDGLNDGGIEIGDDELLDDEDRAEVNLLISEQGGYVTEFGAVLFDKKAITDGEAAQKPVLWWNKSIMPFYQHGKLSADKNGMYEWLLGQTEEHCTDCKRLSGQRHRLRDWAKRSLIPPTETTDCGGWQCDCKLVKTTERARGRF